MSRGVLSAISGFSGSGKGTVMKKLLEMHPEYALSISCTTRAPRAGETHGVDYFFKSDDEFLSMIENNELIEYAGFVGHFYGTPRDYVEENLKAGKDVLLEIEVQGALKVKELYPEAVLIFVTAPSPAEIEKRLRKRGTESESQILARLMQIEREINYVDRYDYLVINDTIEKCAEDIHCIISSRHCSIENNYEFLSTFKSRLEGEK